MRRLRSPGRPRARRGLRGFVSAPRAARGTDPSDARRRFPRASPAARRAPPPDPRGAPSVAARTSSRLRSITAAIRSSIVSAASRYQAVTASSWPMRCTRSSAWSWAAGVQPSSTKATLEAAVIVSPTPAASSEQTISRQASSVWKRSTSAARPSASRRPVAQAAPGKASNNASPISRWRVKTTSFSPVSRKLAIHSRAPSSLPRAAISASCVIRTSAWARRARCSASRPRSRIAVARASSSRPAISRVNASSASACARTQLGDVGLRRAVLAAVGDRDRDDHALLGREVAQDVGLAAAHEAGPAQAAVERGELLAAGVDAGEAPRAADRVQAAEDLQLRRELLGAVEDGRAGEQQDDRVLGQRIRDRGDRLRAARRRVLAEVRLVEDERLRRGGGCAVDQGVGDLVAGDGDVVGADGVAAAQPRARAVRQPALGLAQPVEAQRRGRDDERWVGVGGLERRQRLDRLAEAGLVGEERAASAQRVVDGRALERAQRSGQAVDLRRGPLRRTRAPRARRRRRRGARRHRGRAGCRGRPAAPGALRAARAARRRRGSRPTTSRTCA